jgi:hypothetical protein
MDTRQKIITLEQVLRGDNWVAAAGTFDPLTLEQAERLAALAGREPGRKLLAVVEPGNRTLLSAEARAALVAGLRVVDAVVVATAQQVRARGLAIEEDPAGEQRRSSNFVEFVLARQRAKETGAQSAKR